MPCLHQMDPNNFLEQNFVQTLVLVFFCWIIEWFLPGNLNWTWRKNLRRRIRNLRVRDLAEQRHRQDERVFGVPEELLQSHGRGRRGFESSRKCLTNKECQRWIFFFCRSRKSHGREKNVETGFASLWIWYPWNLLPKCKRERVCERERVSVCLRER